MWATMLVAILTRYVGLCMVMHLTVGTCACMQTWIKQNSTRLWACMGASKRDLLWNVGLPRALPYLFASLKIAITLAFVGTVLSETVAANRGIGNVMMIASGNFDVPMVFAGLFILAGLGISLYAVSSFVERRMTGWSQRKSEMAMV